MRPFLRSSIVVLGAVAVACGGGSSSTDGGSSDAARDDSAAPRDAGGDAGASADAWMAFPDGAAGPDLGAADAGGALDGSVTSDGAVGTACGSVVCGDGMRCCSEACSLCGPLGASCPAIACYDAGPVPDASTDGAAGIPACRPMDATGTGTCDHLLGYASDGVTCRAIRGCTCTGHDCGSLYSSLATCAASIAPCAAALP